MTYPSQQPPRPGAGLEPTSDEKSLALIAHLSALVAMVVSAGWLSFVGPLIVWFVARNRGDFARRSAAGAFNFNLSMWVLTIIGWICFFTVILIPVSIVLWIVAGLGMIVFHIIGAVRTNKGRFYRYPMQFIRILS